MLAKEQRSLLVISDYKETMAARIVAAAFGSSLTCLLGVGLVKDRLEVSTEGKKHFCVENRKFDPNCGDFKIFSGSAHPELAKNIAKHLGAALQPAAIGKFNDGEVSIKVSSCVV